MSRFVHLHTHSHYSLLSALPKADELVAQAKKFGMTALALTDAGNLYGAIEFYKTCKKKEIKPILGIDAYLAVRGRRDMQAGVDNRRNRLVLLAKDYNGYQNLVAMVTLSHLEGFYYKPRIDDELITTYKEGLIAIAPSFSSDISVALRSHDVAKAKERIAFYIKTYGHENFYIEITRHPEIDGHEGLMQQLIKLAKETGTQLVAAHDVYYLNPEDKIARETLTLVNTHGDVSDRINTDSDDDFSFLSPEEIDKRFMDIPEAIENTAKIADMCNLEIVLGKWIFPNYIVESGLSYDDELRRIAYEGLERRKLEQTPEVLTRLEYELKVIKDKGYPQYFLVVSDLLKYAHENGILTNIRGSVAGSLTTFVCGITNVNPLEYKLPFERFLNPERPSAPDIDMDYADNRRDEIIDYTRRKYGHDKVAQIGTFGTMMARGAVRDIARAMGYDYEIGDRISKLIPLGAQGFPMTIDKALEDVTELREMYEKDETVKRIIDMAKKIEGCARHISVHAAGVVIAPRPLIEYVPLQYDTKGEKKIITQYDMHAVGEDGIGLLKFDFLGIKNLSILADAVDRVKKIENIDVDIENIPLDDTKTFEMLARGETIGLFQLNGSGMTKFLVELKPSTIHDINAMVALYRPGPIESIPQYIERKHDASKVEFLDPRMATILDRSYGVITYQDDVMMIAIELGGYSWLEADKLRKAMGKKIPKEMEEQKSKLFAGLVKKGMSESKAKKLWTLIEPFAAYGFNKCLTGDTRITDAKTGVQKTILELYRSKKIPHVLSMNDSQKFVSSPVTAIMENGIKKVFELRTQTGKTIRATANHPFYTWNGWKNLEDIPIGTHIATPRVLKIEQRNETLNHYRAVVLGYLISEGNLCHPHGVYYYSTQKDEITDFVTAAQKFANIKCTFDYSKSTTAVYCGQIDQKKGNSIAVWTRTLGLAGKKATNKSVPVETFTWSAEELAILLGKMWQGDGCVSIKNEQLYYATSSKQLAHDVSHLLLRCGIISTIHTKYFKYRSGLKTGYTVNITHRQNITLFAHTVGIHLIGKKQTDLDTLLSLTDHLEIITARGTKDVIPAPILSNIRHEMQLAGLSVKEISQETGLSERLFSFDARKIGYSRETISHIAQHLDSQNLKTQSNNDIYWDTVVSITPAGEEMTYDLTVNPHHNFIANDIVVHNSHAASYGRVAYQTAYMKANFPAIYMSAVLTADSGDVEKIGEIITECKRMKIPILPPDINESFSQFTVIKGELDGTTGEFLKDRIRFGLVTIKNFGQGIATAIIDERKTGGRFMSLINFLDRVKDKNLNKKSLESLIKAGALDCFGTDRGTLLGNLESLLAYNKEHDRAPQGQDSLFGLMSDTTSLPTLKLLPTAPITARESLMWEKELLGLYISGHPLDRYRSIIEKRDMNITKAKETLTDGAEVIIAGIIEEIKPISTKKGDMMAFIRFSDFTGTIETVAFPKVLAQYKELITLDRCLAIKAKMSERNGQKSLLIDKLQEI